MGITTEVAFRALRLNKAAEGVNAERGPRPGQGMLECAGLRAWRREKPTLSNHQDETQLELDYFSALWA